MYPRTIKESVRRKDDSRKQKRDVRNERKKKVIDFGSDVLSNLIAPFLFHNFSIVSVF